MVKTADYAFITEHAVRRFLERVCEMPYAGMSDAEAICAAARDGVDIPAVRRRMQDIVHTAAMTNAMSVKKDGFKYLLDRGVVISVVPDNGLWTTVVKRRK